MEPAEGPREKYRRALRSVVELRDEHPRLHESVLLVMSEALGQEMQRFYAVPAEQAATEGVRSHAASKALNAVYATLCAPEGRIRALDNPPGKPKEGEDPEVRQRLYTRLADGIKRKLGLIKDPTGPK